MGANGTRDNGMGHEDALRSPTSDDESLLLIDRPFNHFDDIEIPRPIGIHVRPRMESCLVEVGQPGGSVAD